MPGMKKTMNEWKSGTLKSSSGAPVKSQKQAIAIGLSEQRNKKFARGGSVRGSGCESRGKTRGKFV